MAGGLQVVFGPLVTRREGSADAGPAERAGIMVAVGSHPRIWLWIRAGRVVTGGSEKRITADFADDADRDRTRTLNPLYYSVKSAVSAVNLSR
jgi:hypothetical protein